MTLGLGGIACLAQSQPIRIMLGKQRVLALTQRISRILQDAEHAELDLLYDLLLEIPTLVRDSLQNGSKNLSAKHSWRSGGFVCCSVEGFQHPSNLLVLVCLWNKTGQVPQIPAKHIDPLGHIHRVRTSQIGPYISARSPQHDVATVWVRMPCSSLFQPEQIPNVQQTKKI